MTNTVNAAFNQFMKDVVNLEPNQTSTARSSRDFLKGKIEGFDDFFPLYGEKTKIRPLDDIDMIFTLSAYGCTWTKYDGTVFIETSENSPDDKDYRHDNSYQPEQSLSL